MVWPPDAPWSPWWRTTHSRAEIICRFLKVNKKDIVYDLGSGDGTLLITAAKEFGAHSVGVEIDPLRVFLSRLLAYFNGVTDKVRIERKNFFDCEIKDATIVFMYLVPKALGMLKPKLLRELRPGTRIVTFVYMLDLPVVQSDLKNEIYVYVVPQDLRVGKEK
jgi:ribosomal protein L11 methylase PrmA